jgi:hypothetical protein
MMMRGGLIWRASIAICFAVVLIGAVDQKTKNALKVEHILKTIEGHHSRSDGKDLTAAVTEAELNDYIGHRLAQEKSPFINGLKVNLLDNNHVRGNIRLDAKRLSLDLFFGEELDFDFTGILHTQGGAGRIELSTLQLHGQPVQPQMLDMVLSAIALCSGTEPASVGDWYELPKGVKRMVVKKGRADLYY